MIRAFNKVFLGVLSFLLVSNIVMAVDSEFKNSLVKVELLKSGDGTYNIDLYTQSKFIEPVKVIKKSDLNYYILLPETKNKVSNTKTQGSDIRSITAVSHNYAGQDINNGYTKININTSKPVNFKVNVKNMAAINKASQVQVKTATIENKKNETVGSKETKVQKKNSDFQSSKKVESTKKSVQPVKKVEKVKPKVEVKKVENKSSVTAIEKAVMEDVEKAKTKALEEQKEIKGEQLPDISTLAQEEQEAINKEQVTKEELEEIENIVEDDGDKASFLDLAVLKEKARSFTSNLENYGIGFKDLLFMFSIFFITIVFIFALLTKKSASARLKRKKELLDLVDSCSDKKTGTINNNSNIKNDGKYFVFDKNVKQTGFYNPATSSIKRNYELSSYEPELNNKYKRPEMGQYVGKTNEAQSSECDIIQKILKEDSIIELPEQKTIPIKPKEEVTQKQNSNMPIQKPLVKQEKNSEPIVLSSVEIAPERGFMCVSYNNNIRLMGYIFDDVFAIYNFNRPKLENYEITYRLTEKDDKYARFIVRVAGTKMMIKVSKSYMEMEVLL